MGGKNRKRKRDKGKSPEKDIPDIDARKQGRRISSKDYVGSDYVCIVTQDDSGETPNYFRGNETVKVLIGGDVLVDKYASEVRKGDIVLSKKHFLETTLDELEWLMEKDPRYNSAKYGLHIKNREGELITLLRYHLIKGCAQQGAIKADNQDDLERRILREGGRDFSTAEYAAMTDLIHRTLVENYDGPEEDVVSSQTIKNWIAGSGYLRPREDTKTKDTLFPRNWELFQALANVNPFFNNFYADYRKSRENEDTDKIDLRNLHDLYNFYVYVRRQTAKEFVLEAKKVMQRLQGGKTTEAEVEEEIRAAKRGGTRFDITPIFREIWRFYDKQETQYVPSVVKRRDDIDDKVYEEGKGREKGYIRSKAVLHRGDLPLPSARMLSRKDIATHHMFLLDVANLALLGYAGEEISKYTNNEVSSSYTMVSATLGLFGLKNPEIRQIVSDMRLDGNSNAMGVIQDFYKGIRGGTLDQHFDMEKGFFTRMFETIKRLAESYPLKFWELNKEKKDMFRRYYDWMEDYANARGGLDNLSEEQTKVLAKKYEEVMRKIGEYGEKSGRIMGCGGQEIPTTITSLYSQDELQMKDIPDNLKYGKGALNSFRDIIYMDNLARYYLMQGHTLMTRAQAQKILEGYKMGEAMKLIPPAVFSSGKIGLGLR